ncbi:MAG: DUF4286 family protein [Bacteroidales bacterium]|nr:DUF4286 family protein [Bacteroidales bacterium]
MIIFNTTYCLDTTIHDECLVWLKESYIPVAVHSGEVNKPTLARIYSHEEGVGENYSLQFKVKSIEILEHWYESTGNPLHQALNEKFGEKVLTFTTLMEEVTL